MQLGFFKIFALCRDNKRLFNIDNPNRTIGIYDAKRYTFKEANKLAKAMHSRVSVLLGNVVGDTKLICLDLDDCYLDNGAMESETKEFIKEFRDDEWENSNSGTGIHIYILTKLDLETFIVKDMEGCKSFECYTNKRHIMTTTFDFTKTSLNVGEHDEFLQKLYEKAASKRNIPTFKEDIIREFDGKEIRNEQDFNSVFFNRQPVTDMRTLRGLGYKDPMIIECIDAVPSTVDQSAHDAKLVRKLMYYCLSFDAAWEMAKKTNYYKAKDTYHKIKFDKPEYKERTRKFIERGTVREPYQGGHI